MMFFEDNGFVLFPFSGPKINVIEDNKTIVYLVAYENENTKSDLSSITIESPGDFISDDVLNRPFYENVHMNFIMKSSYDMIYFPDDVSRSIPFVAVITIGWIDKAYEYKDGKPWRASFIDLTEDGKRIYYAIKKLHNNKEIRILTFNNI